ncbi:MAG: YqgE/AlgH family protein [Flavobacteriales bacterium]|nr:YqgE/AlgH family protein [Flavobacteriales bacterium]MCX7767754.1 YqgE/AlgH family protein [Flavobacteriales bacterium]MDW8409351.1 YqgE/AlgH family protein [Flavobacteriales bacterium]
MVQQSSKITVGQGQLLIASPFLNDRNFRKSVVLLAEHGPEGSLGFIINHKTSLTLGQVLEGVANDWPIFYGGPVGHDSLFYVHTLGTALQGARHVVGNIWWGGSFDDLKRLLLENRVPPDALKLFAGYSGWGKGQLLDELEENAWIVHPARGLNVLDDEPEELWRSLIQKTPGYALWYNMPEAPYLN